MTRRVQVEAMRISYRNGQVAEAPRALPLEVPIAFSYAGSTHAVMMATPADLIDFATGFSLTEGIIRQPGEILDVEMVEDGEGIDIQVRLIDEQAEALRTRRRHMAGPVGCGLCGIESIEQSLRPVTDVSKYTLSLTPKDIATAVQGLADAQPLFATTRAVHGAGFYVPGEGLTAVREDVGRHNALDKICGAILRSSGSGENGAVVVTSRLSVEMVQKAAMLRCPILIAISAPSTLAVETAERAGMTLVALARGEDFDVFTHSRRIVLPGN